MKFYTFGDKSKPVILLIPGTCCHWTIFNDVIPLLKKRFYVTAVSFDGFDENENTVYPTMFANMRKIRLTGTEHMDKEYHQKWFHVKACIPAIPVFAVMGVLSSLIMIWIW